MRHPTQEELARRRAQVAQVMAKRLGIPLITADRRLYQRIGHFPDVLWLGDYAPTRAG